MQTLKNRIVSRNELIYALAASIFVIHIWSIYNMLEQIPAWILRLGYWDLAGVISYTLVFALIESLIVILFLIILAAVLPARIFKDKFVAISSAFIFLAAAWIVPIHLYEKSIRSWGIKGMLPLLVLAGISFGVSYALVMYSNKFEIYVNRFMQRVTVLAYVYVFIDLIAVIIIVSRNV